MFKRLLLMIPMLQMLLAGNYSILQFTSHHYRVAYDRRKLAVPEVVPPYYQVENWVMSTWWSRGDFDK